MGHSAVKDGNHKRLEAMEGMKSRILLAACVTVFSCGPGAWAQITITSEDMFNQIGQHYRAYANKSDVDVTGLLGSPGGPQAWDFSTGPQDVIYRFDYVAVDDGGNGVDFPKAKFAERKTDELDGSVAYMYLEQSYGVGRINYGFYDPAFSAEMPSNPFSAGIVDFPESMTLGKTWSASTSWDTEILSIPAIINYNASATVDAYGIINLPQIGFGECLRVNEVSEYVIQVDFDLEGNYQTVATYYVRNYYWLRHNQGIVAQMTSRELPTPPPDGFTTAAAFVRTFEVNHPTANREPGPVKDLRLTLSDGKALLIWSKTVNTTSYRIEYSDQPWQADSWKELQTTTANFLVDDTLSGAATRFYRIVSLK